jgi:hypothetical protein
VGLLLAFVSAACSKSQGNSTVVVTVMAAPSMPAATQLQAVWTNAGSFGSETVPPVSAAPLAFDPAPTITLSGAWNGQLDVAVIALDATSTAVASGTAVVDIVPGASSKVTIQLAVTPLEDAGSPDDALHEPLDADTSRSSDAGF